MCHAACTNFAGLFVVRLILGMCEGAITAGFMIVSSMFYTRNEQTVRVGYWCAYHFLEDSNVPVFTVCFTFSSLDERNWWVLTCLPLMTVVTDQLP